MGQSTIRSATKRPCGGSQKNACLEDIDFRHPRGLDKSVMMQLASRQLIKEANNLLIVGPTRIGKTFLAFTPEHKAEHEFFERSLLIYPYSKGFSRY